ncbi:hypothetical protein GH714_002250 [Hevea brasiliensis]|uniref:Uncharacterized protein n=1 Tax=Hevea brasiliensis TaxID=3981 RepID=A0A6A6K3D7_HEVBR|nr:hypothetical protein GH714_002250 [Hevea brasiliensis]
MICYVHCMGFVCLFSTVKSDFGSVCGGCRNGGGGKTAVYSGGGEERNEKGKDSFRYTRPVLQSSLQLMGCKARHAFKISQRVFELMRNEPSGDALLPEEVEVSGVDVSKGNGQKEYGSRSSFELYKRRTTVMVRREAFLNVVCDSLTEYKYVGPNQRADLVLACRIRERKESVTVLLCVEGFKAQSEMVIDSLDRLITAWEERKESVVVEDGLMKKHPSIIPFMIYITNEDKHLERFAVRAKYMTLDPAKNKYVKYIRNIRTIQDYLCKRADKHLVPKINNTNVDKSVAAIHATVFSCLRRRHGLFDSVIFSGKSVMGYGPTMEEGSLYGPLQVGKAEPVNLQFGHFGISAWPSDVVPVMLEVLMSQGRTGLYWKLAQLMRIPKSDEETMI